MAPRRRVILDCDPGHDDAMAILLAAARPELELVAITTVAGNQAVEKVTLNARRVCTVAGIRHVPIAAGCDRPMVGEPLFADTNDEGWGLDELDWPDPTVDQDPRHALDVMAAALADGPLSIVATGPLTNVGTLLQRRPELADRIEAVALMGGAIGLGNWTPGAEFNIYADPEAAQAVFSSGLPVTVVPLEATHRALATEEVLARIDALQTPVARLSAAMLRLFQETYERVFGFADPPIHDPCAVAYLVDREIVTTRHLNVVVDTGSELSRGRTVCDVYGTTGRVPNADVGIDLDAERFWDLMIGAIASYPA